MDLDLGIINLLILFGAIHGLIFSIILFLEKRHPGAKHLGMFMLVLAYNGFETFGWSSGMSDYTLAFDIFPYVLIYALGPSLYCYMATLLEPEKKWRARDLLTQYAPFLFQLVVISILWLSYLFVLINESQTARQIIESIYPLFHIYSEPLSVAVFIFYLVKSVKLYLKREGDHLISLVSKKKKEVLFGWAFTLLIFMIVLALWWAAIVIIPLFVEISDETKYYPIEIGLVVFIYWVAFVGYHKMKSIDPKAVSSTSKSVSSKKVKSSMDQLRHAMEKDKLYLDPKLTRQKLAEHLKIDQKEVSAVLNQYADQSFSSFVNGYRVKEACEKMLSKKNSHLTISGIALESGFNSQATFQRSFKIVHGQSPKAFLQAKKQKK